MRVFAGLLQHGCRLLRRLGILLVGGVLALAGVIMLFTPGPGLATIALGLAVLALEFAWARCWLDRLKSRLSPEQLNTLMRKARAIGRSGAATHPPSSGD